MTLLPPWTPFLRSRSLFPGSMMVFVAAVAVLGCADNHVGRPCDIGVPKSQIDPTKTIINPAALECPSRICLLPAQNAGSTGSVAGLCTVECSSDDDCADGEKGSASNANNNRCLTGFVCRAILPLLSTNSLSCKPLCVCKDFLTSDDLMVKKPSSCP